MIKLIQYSKIFIILKSLFKKIYDDIENQTKQNKVLVASWNKLKDDNKKCAQISINILWLIFVWKFASIIRAILTQNSMI